MDLVGEASYGGMGMEQGLGWTWWMSLDGMRMEKSLGWTWWVRLHMVA